MRPAIGGKTHWVHISQVKYILPADNVINKLPDYSHFGRKTTLRLNPDKIPDLNWELVTTLNMVQTTTTSQVAIVQEITVTLPSIVKVITNELVKGKVKKKLPAKL